MEFHTKLILHPTDFSDNSIKALKAAVEFLSIPKTRLVVLHVSEPHAFKGNITNGELKGEEKARAESSSKEMDNFLKKCFGTNMPLPLPEKIIQLNSIVYKGILDYIVKSDPFMVVIGQKGHSKLPHLGMGSNTKHLIEKSTCPVLVIPAHFQPE